MQKLLKSFILIALPLFFVQISLLAKTDTVRISKDSSFVKNIESAAEQGFESILSSPEIAENTHAVVSTTQKKYTKNVIIYKNKIIQAPAFFSKIPKKVVKTVKKSKKNHKVRKAKVRKSWFGRVFGNFIELDWLMVALFTVIPALLIAGLYILLRGTVLSFFEMFLFALGFGVAVFAFYFAGSENDTSTALYEYFIKYGIFSWVGILMIIAGFVGLFGGAGGSLLGYMLIGAILGGIAFIISLFKKDSILNK